MTVRVTQHAIERASQRAWHLYMEARQAMPGGLERGRAAGREREPLGLVQWLVSFATLALRHGQGIPSGIAIPGMRGRMGGLRSSTSRPEDRRVVLDGNWALMFIDERRHAAGRAAGPKAEAGPLLITLVELSDEHARKVRMAAALVEGAGMAGRRQGAGSRP